MEASFLEDSLGHVRSDDSWASPRAIYVNDFFLYERDVPKRDTGGQVASGHDGAL